MPHHARKTWVIAGLIGVLGLVGVMGDVPALAQTTPTEARDERPVQYWIDQLDSDQFLSRQAASKKLLSFGDEAVQPLADVTSLGRLEQTERAIAVLQTMALKQSPDDQTGAWGALSALKEKGGGAASLRAEAALELVAQEREQLAYARLSEAGVKLGFREFVIDTRTLNENLVLIDSDWNGDAQALRWLRWVRGVAYAVVRGTAIRGEVIEQLVRMPDLRTVSITEGKIEGDIFTPLSTLLRIDELEFRYVELRAEDADKLAKLPIRSQLVLMRTMLPADAEERLRDAMPGLSIVRKEGGFLGVKCNNFAAVCQIDEVVPGGAAANAGLEAGDVILEVDGAPIARFEDLQLQVGRHKPDDEIELTFDRRGEIKKVKLKLMAMSAV